jgi:hypothetical protein
MTLTKIGTWVALLLVAASTVSAESLGDAAKRERERREKNKAQGVDVKVIGPEELASAPEDGGKGTFNEGTTGGKKAVSVPPPGRSSSPGPSPDAPPRRRSGQAGSADALAVPRAPSGPASNGPLIDRETERRSSSDPKRDAARAKLEATYQRIAQYAVQFVRYVEAYEGCGDAAAPGTRCSQLAVQVVSYAVKIAKDMDQADDDARRGSLTPGEVRRMRAAYGMDDSYWDRLLRFVQEHRR